MIYIEMKLVTNCILLKEKYQSFWNVNHTSKIDILI